jgi:DNA-directed RNA polymerase specialized sigma24 family protein
MTISQAVNKEYDFWYRFAWKITRDENAAGDLLHDTLDRSIRGKTFADICAREEHRNYITSAMLLSYHAGHYKKQFRQEVVEFTTKHDQQDIPWLGARIDNEQLDVIINKLLPEFDRDLFEVHLINGFSLTKTAKLTGIPKSYIKRNIQYSLEKIRNVVSK